MTAIQTTGLSRSFGSVRAVDSLDLRVTAGSFFGLLGSNGAGKSTVIKMLTTLLPPTSGTAEVAGFDIRRQARHVRRSIGYVPQLISADSALTGSENLDLFARLYGVPASERKSRVKDALEFMDLDDVGTSLVRTYSGGMIRRLEIAPTVGLDPGARHAVWDRLRELQREFGTTVLLTTHDMEEADALRGQLALMHHGIVVASGTPGELKDSVGPEASMDDAFLKYTKGAIDEHGRYRDIAAVRRTTSRLG